MTPTAAAILRDAASDWVDRNPASPGDADWPVVFEIMAAYHELAKIAGYPANVS